MAHTHRKSLFGLAILGLGVGLTFLPSTAFANGNGQAASSWSASHAQGNAGTSGTYNQPQPLSKADHNNTGANDTSASNQYASTRDGSPSHNGVGNGNATGKPCAGCVGKADNKNPPGQHLNGSDHNAGYECDRNQGVGQTNPAHTACQPSTGGCIPSSTNNDCGNTNGSGCTPTPANDNCGNSNGGTGCTPTPANDNCGNSNGGTGPCVATLAPSCNSAGQSTGPGISTTAAVTPAANSPAAANPSAAGGTASASATAPLPGASQSVPAARSGAQSRGLAFTGDDVTGELIAGLALVGVGGLIIAAGRRRRS